MLSHRHFSDHALKHQLSSSLRQQQHLSNRINVLRIEQEKKFKVIERTMAKNSQSPRNRVTPKQIATPKAQFQTSFCIHKKTSPKTIDCLSFRKSQQSSLTLKKQEMLRTRQQWYKQMKNIQQDNSRKINKSRQKELTLKKKRNHQIKLEEVNTKENIRKYWDDRVDLIQAAKMREQTKRLHLFEDSLNHIEVLKSKEKYLRDQLNLASSFYKQNLQTEEANSDIFEENYMLDDNNRRKQ